MFSPPAKGEFSIWRRGGIDFFALKEYNYEYEEGRIIRATECDITVEGELIAARTVVHTVRYYYDGEGNLTKKVITPASGEAQTVYYETADDKTVVKFTAGGNTVTSHSKTDSFGRKIFDELQLVFSPHLKQFFKIPPSAEFFISQSTQYIPSESSVYHSKKNIWKKFHFPIDKSFFMRYTIFTTQRTREFANELMNTFEKVSNISREGITEVSMCRTENPSWKKSTCLSASMSKGGVSTLV